MGEGGVADALLAPGATLLFVSQAVERVVGFFPADLVGRSAFEHAHPEDVGRLRAVLAEVLDRPGVPRTVEMRVQRRDGGWCVLDAVAAKRLAEPAVGAIVVNYRDVTERCPGAE